MLFKIFFHDPAKAPPTGHKQVSQKNLKCKHYNINPSSFNPSQFRAKTQLSCRHHTKIILTYSRTGVREYVRFIPVRTGIILTDSRTPVREYVRIIFVWPGMMEGELIRSLAPKNGFLSKFYLPFWLVLSKLPKKTKSKLLIPQSQ